MGYAIRTDGVYGWRSARTADDCRDNETYSEVQPGPYEPTAEELAADLRAERDRRLAECDWTQMSDTPLDSDRREAWATYRQALRDVPQQGEFPDAVEWPVKPSMSP
jgi:hypothetical protein